MRKKIETKKYEGHVLVDGKWVKHAMSQEEYDATKALIKDAPLLLEEVKRLRKQLGKYTQFVLWVEEEHNEVFDEYERKDEL